MSSAKLKHAPLQEVIFELFWEGSLNALGLPLDEGFDLAQGRFAERIKARLPLHKQLLPDGAPLKVFGLPIHQYWKGEMQWPVVQHGQGMIAVNEIEAGYEWEAHYKPLVIDAVQLVLESYERPLRFNKARLQYIDAYELGDMRPEEFMAENLQTSIRASYVMPGDLHSFNLQVSLNLEQHTIMHLRFASGSNNQTQKPVLLSTILVESNHPMELASLLNWIEFAHRHASDMFKNMLKPEFYASLDQ